MSWQKKSIEPPLDTPIQVVGEDNTPFTCVGILQKRAKGLRGFYVYNPATKSYAVDRDAWIDTEYWRIHEASLPIMLEHHSREAFEFLKSTKLS